MNWKDRLELLEYHSTARDEQKQRLAQNARNTLVDFADELVKRMQPLIERMVDEEEQYRHVVSTNDIECTMDQLLTEAGVAQ